MARQKEEDGSGRVDSADDTASGQKGRGDRPSHRGPAAARAVRPVRAAGVRRARRGLVPGRLRRRRGRGRAPPNGRLFPGARARAAAPPAAASRRAAGGAGDRGRLPGPRKAAAPRRGSPLRGRDGAAARRRPPRALSRGRSQRPGGRGTGPGASSLPARDDGRRAVRGAAAGVRAGARAGPPMRVAPGLRGRRRRGARAGAPGPPASRKHGLRHGARDLGPGGRAPVRRVPGAVGHARELPGPRGGAGRRPRVRGRARRSRLGRPDGLRSARRGRRAAPRRGGGRSVRGLARRGAVATGPGERTRV
jgi:hypothetical protein